MSLYTDSMRCAHCGCQGADHRAADDRCPATVVFGKPMPFPSFKRAGKSVDADASIDAALARFWAAATTFKTKI